MKQAKRYIGFHCAVLISMILIRNSTYSGVMVGLSWFVSIIVYGVEATRFIDFIMAKYPLVYYEYKNYNGYKRGWLWDYAEEHCQKSVTNDSLLLDNCRRYVITTKATVAFAFIAPIFLIVCLEYF